MRIELLVIDPQGDFCLPAGSGLSGVNGAGSLFVPGADGDMDRLAKMVERLAMKLDDIHVTMDSHRKVDISHPMWWKNSSGAPPDPFTLISVADVEAGVWTTRQPGAHRRSLSYLRELEKTKRYPHVIWPFHCLIGDAGHNLHPNFAAACHEWEEKRYAQVDFVTKGSNPWTEHFSGVRAEVPDPEDPSTQVNMGLINTLEECDILLVAGEARSHCLANTVRDIVESFASPDSVKKIHLLEDATNDVPTFEQYGTKFLKDLVAQGMQTTTTTTFLA